MALERGYRATRNSSPTGPTATVANSGAFNAVTGAAKRGFGISSSFGANVSTAGASVSTSFGITNLLGFGLALGALWAADRYLPD